MDEICKIFDKIGDERKENVLIGDVNSYQLDYDSEGFSMYQILQIFQSKASLTNSYEIFS